MSGTILGLLGFVLIAITGARWWRLMQQVRIPRDTRAYVAACGAALLCGALAFALGTGLLGGVAAAIAMLGGGAFLALSAAKGQRATEPPLLRVGAPIESFTATDDAGHPFALASLRGRPFLLKFFRGHWCPYCVAELRRWQELRPELDARGIAIVTVCADRADEIRRGRAKHGLEAVMIPDPELAITDRYHLRSARNFAPRPGVIIPLPIPTTILVDAGGVVRWIDQSSDYMRRSDPDHVLEAIRTSLPLAEPAARAAS